MTNLTLSPIPQHVLWQANRNCNACELRSACNGPVPGEGYTHVDVMFLGEGPGRNEDNGGRPFVGMAGEELESYLWQIGLRREDVWIDNVAKCRPSGRNAKIDWEPKPEHIEICTSLWLEPTIAMVRPKVIAALGATATKYLFGEEVNVGDVNAIPRKIQREWGEIIVVPMYHPAAALRNTGLMRRVQEGFQVVRQVLDGNWVEVKDEYEGKAVYGTDKTLLDIVIADAYKIGRVALDTEYLIIDGTLLCISLSARAGTGVVIMVDDIEGMGRVKELVETDGIITIMHNALADLDKLWNNDIYPTAIDDTLYHLYWKGIRPLGLKIQSKRLLGVEMEEYQDVVRDAQKEVSIEYLEKIAVKPWPNAEPDIKVIPKKEKWKALRFTKKGKSPISLNEDHPLHNVKMKIKVQDEGGMELKVHQPQNIQKKAKKIISDTVGKGADPYVRWKGIPEREREMVEGEFGEMQIAGLDKVDKDIWIPYASRDADCTNRLWEKLNG